MPDVHLLGDVGRRVVHYHPLGSTGVANSEAFVGFQRVELFFQEAVVEGDVDEAGTGDFQRCLAGEIRVRDHVVGDIAGRAAELLGQRKRSVGLRPLGRWVAPRDRPRCRRRRRLQTPEPAGRPR